MRSLRILRHSLVGATGTMLLFLLCATVHAQDLSPTVQVSPSDNDRYAASQATNINRHAWLTNHSSAQSNRDAAFTSLHNSTPAIASVPAAPDSGGPRFPGDLSYHGGQVVVSMEQHAIFLHPNGACPIAGCWGNPERFLIDLGSSEFIHVVDQYTGSQANGRYRMTGPHTNINYTPPTNPFADNDMLAIVHAVVVSTARGYSYATGYENEYHVFLPPGQDECFDSTFTICYSPDIPTSFFFCAYHGSADFSDIGHVLYSVEPFQNVSGCSSRPGTPNGSLVDSTNNVLSHEVFETITDPDGDAWWNSLDNGLFGQEIGDECSFLLHINNPTPPPPRLVYFDPSNVTLNGRKYAAQPEYDNAAHACTTGTTEP
jgi:hypothetical protein